MLLKNSGRKGPRLTLEELTAGIPEELARHVRTVRWDLEALERGG